MAKTRRTYQPSKSRRASFGFMSRNATVGGRRVLKRRRLKGRHNLTTSDEMLGKAVKNKRLSRRRK